MKPFWPAATPNLPIDNTQEVDYKVIFRLTNWGVRADIMELDENGTLIMDIINGHDFETVFSTVCRDYPNAKWDSAKNS
jgi:hypothetical protein